MPIAYSFNTLELAVTGTNRTRARTADNMNTTLFIRIKSMQKYEKKMNPPNNSAKNCHFLTIIRQKYPFRLSKTCFQTLLLLRSAILVRLHIWNCNDPEATCRLWHQVRPLLPDGLSNGNTSPTVVDDHHRMCFHGTRYQPPLTVHGDGTYSGYH